MTHIKSAVIAMIVFLILDGFWLGYFAKDFYVQGIGHLMKTESDPAGTYLSAFVVYLLLVLGVVMFVLPKAAGSAMAALGWGALFGLVCYGVYDFTNMAILNNWPLWITVMDVLWGCIVCAVVSSVTTWISRIF